MSNASEAEILIARMASATTCTPEIIDRYYTLCIPFYREFLGNHWHTGYYLPEGPIGPRDQLRMELHIATSAGLAPDCKVLDVGCGIGGAVCHLAERTGALIRGLTPNAAQIDLARRLARAAGIEDRVAFDQCGASELPYEDASFDAVLFFESPCHFPDRMRFFREARRILRPGGRLAGEDWLAAEGLDAAGQARWIQPICRAWAIPLLGTRSEYVTGMQAAGLSVREAVDLREEMALLRGFTVDPADQDALRNEMERTAEPIRRIIKEGLLCLGEAAAAGAFTLGRFLAVRDPDTCAR
jgi:tocopherol O-methyltransferase